MTNVATVDAYSCFIINCCKFVNWNDDDDDDDGNEDGDDDYYIQYYYL